MQDRGLVFVWPNSKISTGECLRPFFNEPRGCRSVPHQLNLLRFSRASSRPPSLARATAPVGRVQRLLARDVLDRFTPQQSQHDVSLAGGTRSLDWFVNRRFSTAGRHSLVRIRIFHRTPHLGNPVSNFIEDRSAIGADQIMCVARTSARP
jgi:hypothetical protein